MVMQQVVQLMASVFSLPDKAQTDAHARAPAAHMDVCANGSAINRGKGMAALSRVLDAA